MKNKIKNLLTLAVSGLLFSSCNVFAMKTGMPTGYRENFIFLRLDDQLTKKLVAICPTPDVFKCDDYFEYFTDKLNFMPETVIPVSLPKANQLPQGLTLEVCQICIRVSCPGKTIKFV